MSSAESIRHRRVATNGIELSVAEAGGDGPLVLLLHGFPESWYSWRHQLPALAAAGYRVVAPDQRGYGDSDKPRAIEAYDQFALSADAVGLIDALGYDGAVAVGHDWGAPVAWHSALLHPDKVRAVAGLSVPYRGHNSVPPIQAFKDAFKDRFFYILYFQEPGVAEAELEADVPRFIRRFTYFASGDAPRDLLVPNSKPADSTLLEDVPDPPAPLSWLSEQDLAFYVAAFEKGGLRGPLNWYRNFDRTWQRMGREVENFTIHQPALFIAGERDPVLYFSPGQIEAMKTRLADLRDIVLLPGCGHWTQQERPDEVNAALLRWLGEVAPV